MKLVFDIGSNVGNTVETFLSKSEKVVSVEANPRLVNYQEARFRGRNVVIDNRGLSNHNGTQNFRIANINTISTFSDQWINESRFTNHWRWDNGIEVQTVKLDTLIEQYGEPDYIKIDIEGYEWEALMVFTKLIPNMIVAFEWAEEQKTKISEILNHVKTLGYDKFFYTEADEVLFEERINWVSHENFDLLSQLDAERKEKWGMIYFKK